MNTVLEEFLAATAILSSEAAGTSTANDVSTLSLQDFDLERYPWLQYFGSGIFHFNGTYVRWGGCSISDCAPLSWSSCSLDGCIHVTLNFHLASPDRHWLSSTHYGDIRYLLPPGHDHSQRPMGYPAKGRTFLSYPLIRSILRLVKHSKKMKQEDRPAFHRFILFCLEYTKLLHVPPHQQACIIIDAAGAGFAQLDMELGGFLVDLVYNFYPEFIAIGISYDGLSIWLTRQHIYILSRGFSAVLSPC